MINTIPLLTTSLLALPLVAPLFSTAAPALRFAPAPNNEFTFDTGVLRGKLRAGGRSAGLSSVVHLATGIRLDSSMGLLGHYRVFTTNKRYGTAAWDWPSEARLAEDGSVQVRWAANADQPFELRATYRLVSPNAVDLQTEVEAKTNLLKFESFVASYFTPGFTNSAVDNGGSKIFTAAEQSAGIWQAFPRDDSAVAIIKDGRWKLEPNPVDWVIRPALVQPLGYRRSAGNGLTAALMSLPGDCFAVLTPHQTEPHYSMYLSLFGRDLKPSESARAHTCLCIMDNNPSADAVRRVYSLYVKTFDKQ